MHIGRIIGTAVMGLLFLLFVALDLVLFGLIPLNSVIVTLLPVLGLIGGGVLGAMVGRRTATSASAEPSSQ